MKPITAAFLLGVVPASQAALQVVPGATWTAVCEPRDLLGAFFYLIVN
jgi:hypothetical protein